MFFNGKNITQFVAFAKQIFVGYGGLCEEIKERHAFSITSVVSGWPEVMGIIAHHRLSVLTAFFILLQFIFFSKKGAFSRSLSRTPGKWRARQAALGVAEFVPKNTTPNQD